MDTQTISEIEKLAIKSTNEARVIYCSMEIQRLAAMLKDSFIELQEVQKYPQLHDNIAKCIQEINYWSNPLVTYLCYEKNASSIDDGEEHITMPVMSKTKEELPN